MDRVHVFPRFIAHTCVDAQVLWNGVSLTLDENFQGDVVMSKQVAVIQAFE
jgi:hypothetical protein